MQSNDWNFIAATVAGTAHQAQNLAFQDACECEVLLARDGGEIFVAIASDGAGSAKKGREGAAQVCVSLMRETRKTLVDGFSVKSLTENICRDWIENLRNEIKILAEAENVAATEFSCTLLAAIVGADAAVFLQIGDGAIVYGDRSGEYKFFTLPQQGEYANSTNFVTDANALNVLKYELIEKTIHELAMFTDGLQRLAIDFRNARPHQPFFRSMLAPLRAQNIAENLGEKLSEFLDSPKINERTDDDKTLILASRRSQNRLR